MADTRDAPIYNIKAVVRLTGVAADTLRRWESRYTILSPQRSTGGYRMYSARDVDTIRWLKARVDEGLAISRACELLRTQGPDVVPDTPTPGMAAFGAGGADMVGTAGAPAAASLPAGNGVRSLSALLDELLHQLGQMQEAGAAGLISEALNLYTVEQVVDHLITPMLQQVGELWMAGTWTISQEHFASAFIRGRLATLLHSSPLNAAGPLVLVGCAPEELHEIGPLIVALYLRRAGYRVVYLGQNVPLDSLCGVISTLRPAVVCVSATRPDTAGNLRPLAAQLNALTTDWDYRPLLAYGGAVFNRHPRLAAQMGAIYLGASGEAAMQRVRAATA